MVLACLGLLSHAYICILGHTFYFVCMHCIYFPFEFSLSFALFALVFHFCFGVIFVLLFSFEKKNGQRKNFGCYCDTSTSGIYINPQLALMSIHHTYGLCGESLA